MMKAALRTQTKGAPPLSFTPVIRGLLQRKCACGGTPDSTGECKACRKKKLQSRSENLDLSSISHSPSSVSEVPPIVHEVLRSPGQPLDAATLAFMEPRFGCCFPNSKLREPRPDHTDAKLTLASPRSAHEEEADRVAERVSGGTALQIAASLRGHNFRHVRIHADERAAASARAVNALAYTVGSHIVFGSGQYLPDTGRGVQLLAHELAHVVQQGHKGTGCSDAGTVVQQQSQTASLSSPAAPGHFPGCSADHRLWLEDQLRRARNMIRIAQGMVATELTRSDRPNGPVTVAGSAINRYFHTNQERHIQVLLRRLARIEDCLSRGPSNWQCVSGGECRRICERIRIRGSMVACAGPATAVFLCPAHFRFENTAGALSLIHEAAHQAGLGLRSGAHHRRTDIYEHERRFPTLTATEALNTPDAYAALVRELYGLPRTLTGVRIMTPRGMEIIGFIFSPRGVPDFIGSYFSEGARHVGRIPRNVAIENRLSGVFAYETSGGANSTTPHILPEISLRIVLRRTGSERTRLGRPQETVLLARGGRATALAGNRLRPPDSGMRSSYGFNFSFDRADQGTLQIIAEIRDPDSGTALTYSDQVRVRPTANADSGVAGRSPSTAPRPMRIPRPGRPPIESGAP
jgi:hypothetical protein